MREQVWWEDTVAVTNGLVIKALQDALLVLIVRVVNKGVYRQWVSSWHRRRRMVVDVERDCHASYKTTRETLRDCKSCWSSLLS